jgi:hypothetical protein
MRIPGRILIVGTLAAIALSARGPAARAGVDPGLCHSTTARAAIPPNFAVNACFDGSHLTLEDSINYVLEVGSTGAVGPPKRIETDFGLAADAERLHARGNAGIFLPGDKLVFPVGAGAGSVGLTHAPDNGFYAIATTIAAFFPGKPAAVLGAFTALVAELNDDEDKYANCLIGKDWLGQLGCESEHSWNVTYAAGRAAVNGTASDIVAAVLAPAEWAKWVQATVDQALPLIKAAKVIKIAPASATPASRPTTAPSRTAPEAPPNTTTQAAPSTPSPTTVTTGSGALENGAQFSSMCVVAWPTAPTITGNSIQMTMSCNAVPESDYLFTVVTYGDPNLAICPDHPDAYVTGTVNGAATSDYGFKELLVTASSVKVQGQCAS